MSLIDTIKGLFSHGASIADANGDGNVNLADAGDAAQDIKDAVAGAADVNGDGSINPADATEAAQNVQDTATGAVDKLKDQLPQ